MQWGIQQGMHVTGTTSAFGFLQAMRQFETADVSASIRQDVLLLAGSEDHYVPLEQWHDQMRMLKNAHSITARLFTRGESAQNHCQAGNYGLALRTIVNWLDGMVIENRNHCLRLSVTGVCGDGKPTAFQESGGVSGNIRQKAGVPASTMGALMLAVFTVSVGFGVVLPLLPDLIERLMGSGVEAAIVSRHTGLLTANLFIEENHHETI